MRINVPYSSISARKWENQNRALLEICTKALLEDQKNLEISTNEHYREMRTMGGRTNRGLGV